MNKIDIAYQDLLKDILENGVRKSDRTGTGTLSVFGRQIRYKFKDGKFPLLTTKKMYFKGIVTELLWFLRGDTSIEYLVENDNTIWVGDAYKKYRGSITLNNCVALNPQAIREGYAPDVQDELSKEEFIEHIKTDDEFAEKWGELGPVYGKQWRSWMSYFTYFDRTTNRDEVGTCITDQIADAIHILKTNPDDRGIIVSAWNVGELDQMVLRPCHNFFQFYTRELSRLERYRHLRQYKYGAKYDVEYGDEMAYYDSIGVPKRAISLMFNMRSSDVPLGLPFNIASYALLLEIIGKMVNMVPDELIANLGDAHIYKNQIDGIKEQLTREPYELPTVKISDRVINDISEYTLDDIILENYQSHPAIKMPLSN